MRGFMQRLMMPSLMMGLMIGLAASAPAVRADVGAVPQLTPADVQQRVEAAGYSNVTEIELDDGQYEVDATSQAGERVDLHVDAVTGAVELEAD